MKNPSSAACMFPSATFRDVICDGDQRIALIEGDRIISMSSGVCSLNQGGRSNSASPHGNQCPCTWADRATDSLTGAIYTV